MSQITLDFIQTRIREQEEYIEKLMATPLDANRKIELLDSAKGVLKYWKQKEYERSWLHLETDGTFGMITNDFKPVYKENGMNKPIEPKKLTNCFTHTFDDRNIIYPQLEYQKELASVLPPSEEFESMAAKITQPFSLQQVLG